MRHAPTGSLPSGFECVERRVHRAMVGYYVQDAVIHQFDPRPHCFPDAIHATTQNRPGRLSLWLVRRGRSLLPWHGSDVLTTAGAHELFTQRTSLINRATSRSLSRAKRRHLLIGGSRFLRRFGTSAILGDLRRGRDYSACKSIYRYTAPRVLAGVHTLGEPPQLLAQWWWRYSSILMPNRRNTIPNP